MSIAPLPNAPRGALGTQICAKALSPIFLLLLISCASKPAKNGASSTQQHDEIERRREAADARSRQAADERPYPKGWDEDKLPRYGDPGVAESIHLRQTMAEVTAMMGQKSWSREIAQGEFLQELRTTYRHHSSHTSPREVSRVEERLPSHGRFVKWQYQGFPMTYDWVVVFFASTKDRPNSEPRVVARGVFALGDY